MAFWHLSDVALTLLHLGVVAFNVLGWCLRATRKAHVAVLGLTLASWLVAGAWYGWGYCFLTDWHWQVRARLGDRHLPASFLQWLPEHYFGVPVSGAVADAFAVAGLLVGMGGAVWVRRRR